VAECGGMADRADPEELRNFQESDVQMLLVNGTVDFSTPPTALDEARPYWRRRRWCSCRNSAMLATSTPLQQAAFERLITSYLDTGVGDDGLYVYQPLQFKAKLSNTVIAKALVAAMIVVPALLILGIVLVARRNSQAPNDRKLNRHAANQGIDNRTTFIQIDGDQE